MTREEIKELKGLAASMGLYDDKNPCKRAVILGKAIETLEQEPKTEPCEEQQREFIGLVVEYPNPDLCIPEFRGKPYFSIKYRQNGIEYIGFGTYKIEIFSQWIKEYFIPSIQPKANTLEQIRAEIEELRFGQPLRKYVVDECLEIINKYIQEG